MAQIYGKDYPSSYFEYPASLKSQSGGKQHCINFQAFDFKKNDSPVWGCALYIPGDSLTTSFKSAYDSPALGLGMGKGMELMNKMRGGVGGGGRKDASPSLAGSQGEIQAVALKLGAAKLGGDKATVIAEQKTGFVINPYIVAAYKGPTDLRQHSFSFKMMPEDNDESVACMNITRLFKAAMLPSHAGGNSSAAPSMLFGYPDQFEIKYMIGGKDLNDTNHAHLFKIGRSVLTECDLNYATESLPLFFEGTQHPATIEMKLTFMETEVMYREKVMNKGF